MISTGGKSSWTDDIESVGALNIEPVVGKREIINLFQGILIKFVLKPVFESAR